MTELAKLNLDDDFAEAVVVEDASRWMLKRTGDLEVQVHLSPDGHPDELFCARLRWIDYPGDYPPSVVFVDPETAQTGVPTAWPTGEGFRPPTDICATWTLEGYQAHPEWKTDLAKRFRIEGNALLLLVRTLQHELDCRFTGRHK